MFRPCPLVWCRRLMVTSAMTLLRGRTQAQAEQVCIYAMFPVDAVWDSWHTTFLRLNLKVPFSQMWASVITGMTPERLMCTGFLRHMRTSSPRESPGTLLPVFRMTPHQSSIRGLCWTWLTWAIYCWHLMRLLEEQGNQPKRVRPWQISSTTTLMDL